MSPIRPASTPHRSTLLALVAMLATLLAAAPAPAAETRARSYDTRILEPDAAEAIVLEVCRESPAPCTVLNVSPSSISVDAAQELHARISAALADAQRVPSTQVFQVTIVEAENNGDRGLGDVPEPARAALEDARAFLPFNGYQLLGTAVLRTNESASAMVPGPGPAEYLCRLRFRHSVTRQGRELVLRSFALSRMPAKDDGGAYVEGASAVDVLETSFGMRPGETVVVGTSKLEGSDRALVVLLTAVD